MSNAFLREAHTQCLFNSRTLVLKMSLIKNCLGLLGARNGLDTKIVKGPI